MEHIKLKIEKLLRLALSSNPNEAKVASEKAIRLMEKYSITREALSGLPLITREIELEYARVPGWVGELYSNIAFINGCYAVWKDGYKGERSSSEMLKAKMILTGIESDLSNIDYYVCVLTEEINIKTTLFKKRWSSKREMVKSYRMGLVEGLHSHLYKASKTFNASISNNAVVKVDERHEFAKQYYLNKNSVKTAIVNFKKGVYYRIGISDAQNIITKRPIEQQKEIQLKLPVPFV